VARWLVDQGFREVAVLSGGLEAWRSAGLPLEDFRAVGTSRSSPAPTPDAPVIGPGVFLPSLASRYTAAGALPTRRLLATVFVDIAGSTRWLIRHPPEAVLEVVQRFMRLVTEVALAYCGDVKDFEGDGALLYFESVAEAAQAAFAIRDALRHGCCPSADGLAPVQARLSLTAGEVVVGVVGSAMRQAVALVGPSVSVGSRLLKQAPVNGIVASGDAVEALAAERPALAQVFRLVDPAFVVPGADGLTVPVYVAEETPAHAAVAGWPPRC
jgi:class 3 adenylate cyclase